MPNMSYALLVIDMQNGYFPSREDKAALPALVANINGLIMAFTKHEAPAIKVVTIHNVDKSTWTRPMKDSNEGFCVAGSEEAKDVEGLDWPQIHETIIKTRDNAFLYTDLAALLERLRVETLILAGVSTHECVASTALEASERDYLTVIAKQSTHSPKSGYAGAITNLLGEEYGTEELTNREIIARLAQTD